MLLQKLTTIKSFSTRSALAFCITVFSTISPPVQAETNSSWNGPTPLRDIPLPAPEKRYPVKNDTTSIREAYSKSEQWEGRAVALEGSVKSIQTNARGQPSIEFDLGGGGDTTIWATWPLANTKGMDSFLRVGERLRVFGWMGETKAWSKIIHLDLPRQNSMMLLPICLVKVRNSDAVFDNKYVEYCEAWQKGYMPPDMARK